MKREFQADQKLLWTICQRMNNEPGNSFMLSTFPPLSNTCLVSTLRSFKSHFDLIEVLGLGVIVIPFLIHN